MSTRNYIVVTCKKAARQGLKPPRPYGYTIVAVPPIERVSEGEDVEGIGWVPHRFGPRKYTVHCVGWYRHRSTAQERARTYPGIAQAMAEQWGKIL